MKYSKRMRNGKTYITITSVDDVGYSTLAAELRRDHPLIRITSGGSCSVTGVIDVFEILKKE